MIPVIWYNKCRGNWDHGTLMEIFEKHPDVFRQWNDDKLLNPVKYKKAIFIVAGCPDPEVLRDYLLKWDAGVVILTSEEDAYFNWQYAIPDHLDVWTQYYSPSTKSDIKTRLLLGPPSRIKDFKINKQLPKKYLWSFVGQVQNPFRQQCVDVLRTLPDGYLREVELFGGHGANGMEYQEYLDIMCQSKYVICPSGSMCVDSFRLYEAMECGAIPITDRRAPRDPDDFNYWDNVFDVNNVWWVDSWIELEIPRQTVISKFVFDLSPSRDNNDWWLVYKKDIEQKLLRYANG